MGGRDDRIILGNKQPFGIGANEVSVGQLVSNGLRILFIVALLAVLIMFVWAAFEWVTSGGDKEKISHARGRMTWAVIGLAFLALALFLVTIIGEIVGLNPLTDIGIIPRLDDPN